MHYLFSFLTHTLFERCACVQQAQGLSSAAVQVLRMFFKQTCWVNFCFHLSNFEYDRTESALWSYFRAMLMIVEFGL